MTFKRYDKYEVIKIDDIEGYLTNDQKVALISIIETVQKGRTQKGKPACNNYVVVNADEPYAEVVWKLIEIQESNPNGAKTLLENLQTELLGYE